LFLLGALKRRASRRLAAAHGARAKALWAMPDRARAPASLALCALFVGGYDAAPGLALVAVVLSVGLAIDRDFRRAPRSIAEPWPRGAMWQVALGRARRARAARLFGAFAWLDATTPAGASLLASAWALALWRPHDVWLEALIAATPLLFTATRLQLPISRHDAVLAHARAGRLLSRRRRRGASTARAAAGDAVSPSIPSAGARERPASVSADASRRAPDRAA
jgi:hypothetical protein